MTQVPEAVWTALSDLVEEHDLECADNFRAYRVADNYSKDEYEQAEREGCCGSFEDTVNIDSEEWVVGCNYGH